MTQCTSLQWPILHPRLSLNVLLSLHLQPIPLPSFIMCPSPQWLFLPWVMLNALPSLHNGTSCCCPLHFYSLLLPSIIPSLKPGLPSTAALGTPLSFWCWANTWLPLIVPLSMWLLLIISRWIYFTQCCTFHRQPYLHFLYPSQFMSFRAIYKTSALLSGLLLCIYSI